MTRFGSLFLLTVAPIACTAQVPRAAVSPTHQALPTGFISGYEQPVVLRRPLPDTVDLVRLGSGAVVVYSNDTLQRGLAVDLAADGSVRYITHYFPYDTPYDSVVQSYRTTYGAPRDSASSRVPGQPSRIFTWCDAHVQLDLATAVGATRVHVYEILFALPPNPKCQGLTPSQ